MLEALKGRDLGAASTTTVLSGAGRSIIHNLAPSWMKKEVDSINLASSVTQGPCRSLYRPSGFLSQVAERRRAMHYKKMALAACTAGIPVDLFDAMIMQESRYNQNAVSSAGARGLAQLMPKTAIYVGTYDSFSPSANLRGGARYLKEQIDRFGLTTSAIAAYNAGPGNVSKYGGIPPFRETKDYVAKIVKNVTRLAANKNRPYYRVAASLSFEGANGSKEERRKQSWRKAKTVSFMR